MYRRVFYVWRCAQDMVGRNRLKGISDGGLRSSSATCRPRCVLHSAAQERRPRIDRLLNEHAGSERGRRDVILMRLEDREQHEQPNLFLNNDRSLVEPPPACESRTRYCFCRAASGRDRHTRAHCREAAVVRRDADGHELHVLDRHDEQLGHGHVGVRALVVVRVQLHERDELHKREGKTRAGRR